MSAVLIASLAAQTPLGSPSPSSTVVEDPDPAPAYQPPPALPADYDDLEAILYGVTFVVPTDAEVNRARRMLAIFSISAIRVRHVMAVLALENVHYADLRVSAVERRAALAALTGIVIGFAPMTAQQMIDAARKKANNEVIGFVMEQTANVGSAVGLTMGGLWLGVKGAVGAASKGAAMVGGKIGLPKGILATSAYVGVGMTGGIFAVGGVVLGVGWVQRSNRRYPHIIESTFAKDIRIFRGLQRGLFTLPNLPPAA